MRNKAAISQEASMKPYHVQQLLFQLIDERVSAGEVELDYLQIFVLNLDHNRNTLNIVHGQEEPFSIQYHDVPQQPDWPKTIEPKVWVIDDGTHQTMLLPQDY